uniref:Transducer of regulated CREB activity C-terminal domain-containing protein n=1 Tax=Pseudonaja textilis TaxID=8673 RepID=A0A670ZC83_PSETE
MQSSLSNPCLQSSLNAPALRLAPSPLSSQSMPSSLSTPSLSTSLSNPSLPTSLGAHVMPPIPPNPRLPPPHHQPPPPGFGGPASSSSSSSSTASSPAASYAPLNASPRRRVPLSPLTLPMAGDARRQHPKQFSPTMSPTLSSITQGVPLDTSKLPAEQRLPPYPYSQPGVLLQHSQKSQHPVPGGVLTSPQTRQPSSQPPCPYPAHYQPNSMLQHQLNQPLGDFGFGNVSFKPPPTSSFPRLVVAGRGISGGHIVSPHPCSANSTAMNDPHFLGRQNLSNCSRHGPIPNILTGDSPPGISKEFVSILAGMPGFEMDTASLGLDEDLKIEPLSLDGLNMLSNPYVLLSDPSVEDSFRTDRLQ